MPTRDLLFVRNFSTTREFLNFSLALQTIVFCGLVICFSLLFIAPASSEEENSDTDFTLGRKAGSSSASSTPNKRFIFFTKSSTYLRYGGVSVSDSTNLIGYSRGRLTDSDTDFVMSNNYTSYASPLVSLGSFRFDPYELELGFEARAPLSAKLNGGVRVSFDALELGELLSGSVWGGREVYPWQHFSSGPLREGFAYLSHPRWGKFSLGFLEGVASLLDGGARAISAGSGGLYDGFSRTPWQIHRLGLTLGRASSENFPKVQYLSPSFYGIDIGIEWFTNAQPATNKLSSLPYPNGSNCIHSLFYRNDQALGTPSSSIRGNGVFIADTFFPDNLPSSLKCWQLSSASSGWHPNASRFITGGNLTVAYEKSFTENLSLEASTSYGILYTSAHSTDYRFADRIYPNKVIGRASSLDQAFSLGTSLHWRDYSLFSGFVYLFPSGYELEDLSGVRSNESGASGFIWSLGIKADRLIPTRGGGGKAGGVSMSFAQAITKDPYLSDGQRQETSLLNIGSNYPLADGVLLVIDYWYGDAVLNIPFGFIHFPSGDKDFVFYEQRLTDTHEFAIGIKMEF